MVSIQRIWIAERLLWYSILIYDIKLLKLKFMDHTKLYDRVSHRTATRKREAIIMEEDEYGQLSCENFQKKKKS